MTNEQKAAVERAAKNLIKGLKTKVSHCDSDDNDVSWGMQEGILISKGDAKAIIELMESHTAALLERVKELEGLFTPDQMRGQRKHNHVETWYESHIQKEKYREALEDVDRELAHEGFANSTGEGVDKARDIIKEVLKQQ